MEFDNYLADAVAEDSPPSPRRIKEDPRDRHPPHWTSSPIVAPTLTPKSIYKTFGPETFDPVVVDTKGFDVSPNHVWVKSCNDAKVFPKAPRAVVSAVAEAAMAAREDAEDPGQLACRLDLSRQMLSDSQLQALGECLHSLGNLEYLSLASSKLSAGPLNKFLRKHLPPFGGILKELDFSWNRCLGAAVCETLIQLIDDSQLRVLEVLRINGVTVPGDCWERFLKALRGSGVLRVLGIADTRLGSGRQPGAVEALAALVGEGSLTTLDISGNYLSREACHALGEGLAQTHTLLDLDVSHNAGDNLAVTTQQSPAALMPRVEHTEEEIVHKGLLPAPKSQLAREGRKLEARVARFEQKGLLEPKNKGPLTEEEEEAKAAREARKLRFEPRRNEEESPIQEQMETQAEVPSEPVASRHAIGGPPYSPMLLVCEGMMRNKTLKKLTLVGCSLDYAADFLLGEAVARHPCLERLDASSNPHGRDGLACLLRAVGASRSKVRMLCVTDVRSATVVPPAVEYSWGDPSGHYELDLAHPQHRGVVRQLLAHPLLGSKKALDCFSGLSPKTFGLELCAHLDKDGIAEVPTEGGFCFDFKVEEPQTPRGDPNPLAKVQDRHLRNLTPLSLVRSIDLVASFKSCQGEAQQMVFVEALRQALILKAAHVAFFVRVAPAAMASQVVKGLLPAVGQLSASSPLGIAGLRFKIAVHRAQQEALLRDDTSNLLMLNTRNPTGHYRLNLGNSCDRACVSRLQILAAFECELQARQGAVDFSQRGNLEPVRNVRYEGGRDFAYDILESHGGARFCDLVVPLAQYTTGWLVLDYASRAPPPENKAKTRTSEEAFDRFCSALAFERRLPWKDVLQVLRKASDHLVLTALQVRTLAKLAAQIAEQEPPSSSAVTEALVVCWARCCERSTFVSRALLHDAKLVGAAEALALWSRLGSCNVFEWQFFGYGRTQLPGKDRLTMDLAMHDDRKVAKFLLTMAEKESLDEHSCLAECKWSEERLLEEWQEEWRAELPDRGSFTCKYTLASQEVNPEEKDRRYSSVCNNDKPGTGHARAMLDSEQAWSAAKNAAGEWMQMDLGKVMGVTRVVTQGRDDGNKQAVVTRYRLEHSQDGSKFEKLPQVFDHMSPANLNDKVHAKIDPPFYARYVKLVVQEWQGQVTLRAGVLVQVVDDVARQALAKESFGA